MENLEAIIQLIDSWLWGRWLVFVLLALGILYTISNGFIQVRHFGFIIRRTLIDSYNTRHEDKGNGSISTFKAMMVTLAGNVGGGNVVGVATAILSGGMGAVFWMWVAAFFGMALKYGEIVLSQMYRGKDENGNLLSGPMYYIRDGLKMPWLGVVIAVLMCTKMMGANLVQSNTISGILYSNYGVPTYMTGVVLIILLLCITLGGLKRLANLAMNLVPAMSIFYIVIGLLVVLLNIQQLPHVFAEIFTQAWSFDSVAGGTGGYVIAKAMQYGIPAVCIPMKLGKVQPRLLTAAPSFRILLMKGLLVLPKFLSILLLSAALQPSSSVLQICRTPAIRQPSWPSMLSVQSGNR